MKIVLIEIKNFRGIKSLRWTPSPYINCLIGPGDSTKTTILDAIELVLNPRSYTFADDCDFHNLDIDTSIEITVTMTGFPPSFHDDTKYGLHLRGWNAEKQVLEDEPGKGLEEALSIRLTIDKTLEAHWGLYHERLPKDADPPALRYKDAQEVSTTRLGPYAEHHLGWSRQSVLSRMGDTKEKLTGLIAEARRAARKSFNPEGQPLFLAAAAQAQALAKVFSVPIRDKYSAELDVEGINITTGGISLHDQKLPLRCLGTGSTRLIVSALQHATGNSHIALVDEIEHGLEPHRIARLLKYLRKPSDGTTEFTPSQVFMTTHSPVVIRELTVNDLSTVRAKDGKIDVRPVKVGAATEDQVQAYLRSIPEAFLARRVVIGEGKTECGLIRGIDNWWTGRGSESFAYLGIGAVDGGGAAQAPAIGVHLLGLGYEACLLLDSDEPPPADKVAEFQRKGGKLCQWDGNCSTEQRIFNDVPWPEVQKLVALAVEFEEEDSVKTRINAACKAAGIAEIADLTLPKTLDNPAFRKALGFAAKKDGKKDGNKKPDSRAWFKKIDRGEKLAEIIGPVLVKIADKPLASVFAEIRAWADVQ